MNVRGVMVRVVRALTLALPLSSCAPQPAAGPLEKVSVLLNWTHQAQFAGRPRSGPAGPILVENEKYDHRACTFR